MLNHTAPMTPATLHRTSLAALLALLLAACAAPPPPPLPQRPAAPTSEVVFDAGIDFAVDDLLIQARRLPAFNVVPERSLLPLKKEAPPPARSVIAVDPAIDGNTGQQTAASKLLDTRLLQRATARFDQFEVLPVSTPDVLPKAQFLLAGTLTPVPLPQLRRQRLPHQPVADRHQGPATSWRKPWRASARKAWTRHPTAFFRDSPVADQGPRRGRPDPHGADAARWRGRRGLPLAHARERLAGRGLAPVRGEQLHRRPALLRVRRPPASKASNCEVLNGLYLVNTQLGRTDEAMQAFSKIVALGLATNSLSVKFLFRPGSTGVRERPQGQRPLHPVAAHAGARSGGRQDLFVDRGPHQPHRPRNRVNEPAVAAA